MPHKITNITGNPKFKQKVPVHISFDDGLGFIVKHTIQPEDSLILYFIPTCVHKFQLANMVTVEFVKDDYTREHPVSKLEAITTPTVDINNTQEDIKVDEDFIKEEQSDPEEGKKTRIKRKNTSNDEENEEPA